VARAGGDFFDAVKRYPVVLFNCERVVSRLQDNPRAQIVWSEKYVTSDLMRLGVAVYPGAKPSETWRFVLRDWRIPPGKDVPKALLRDRNPDSPNQTFGAVGHGYLQATPNIMLSFVDSTDIISKLSPGGAFCLWEAKPIPRRDKPIVHRERVETPTTAAASPGMVHGVLLARLELNSR
jgi:hypothetical protein